ncbi:response regulator transcription factor [Cohnella nanjingensis]|uniref:Response regulator transcription factor n=1 Tax=Cohnella nanjingensis TaxID=1387779 RepID=A0A7X0RUZ5_9BACL|nr:response regulator transcription factor [Cohnella nanjingensis]MBB6674068.1 response regulator transcription factor [Cohnella nanjingensis]
MNIVIAEDQGMLRGALGMLLGMEEDMEVVGQAEDGEQALRMVRTLTPDLCLLDIEMPRMTGLEVAETLRKEGHPCKIVILTTFSRTGYFQRAMQAGVSGYLLKDAPIEELAAALRTVMAGKRAISPELSVSLWEKTNPLSERERSVLSLLADGKSVNEIAGTLYLSGGTVRNYISEILQKLDAKNRIDAVAIATGNGWLD